MDAVGNPNNNFDDADVRIRFSLTNVMRRSDLSDYTGELQTRVGLRDTDKLNGTSGVEDQTVSDSELAFTIPCVATASTIDGGSCALMTTADTIVPGLAPEGRRTLYELGQLRVYDGGSDEDADTTADNSLFAVQGVFVP